MQVALEDFLQRLRKANFDIFHPSLQKRNPLLAIQLYLRSWKKKYWTPSKALIETFAEDHVQEVDLKKSRTVWVDIKSLRTPVPMPGFYDGVDFSRQFLWRWAEWIFTLQVDSECASLNFKFGATVLLV